MTQQEKTKSAEKVSNWGSFNVMKLTEGDSQQYAVVEWRDGTVHLLTEHLSWAEDRAQILHYRHDVYGV